MKNYGFIQHGYNKKDYSFIFEKAFHARFTIIFVSSLLTY